jgi:predicted AlkP superfamily phosphohydrolase/phosphomutase/tetratricopeptide (TPR) repeat protein
MASRSRVPVAIALALFGAIVLGTGCRRVFGIRGGPASPRVLLIGIDGADLDIIDRLIASGKLPTFARLEKEGAFGRLRSQEPLMSPIVWTTIATGRPPQDHGVLDFVEIGADGKPTPITSLRRRVPALWNIASDYGKQVGFVGWYASYPAESVRGFEVSDRLAFHQVRSARATSGATYPEKLAGEIRRRFGEPVPDLEATRGRFVSGPGAVITPDGARRLAELSRIYATSEFYRRILPRLQEEFHPDLLAVYFEGVDACGHLFMEDAAPRRAEVSDADFQAFSETVDRYYQYQDEVLGDLLRLEDPSTVTLVVSDHGFKSGDVRPHTSGRADTGLAPLWHRLYGVVFAHGASVRPARIERASILDVAPTVLSCLGIPLSRELAGKPIPGISDRTAKDERIVDRYRPLPVRPRPAAAPADTEAVEKLMALGYLAGGGRMMAHDADGRTSSSYLNEGMVRSQAGDTDGALRAYGKVIELDPKNVNALTTAASIYIKRKDYERAAQLLDRARAVEPDNIWVHLQTASWNLERGRYAAAESELASAGQQDDRLPGVHLLAAKLANARNRPEAALQELDQARKLTDRDDMVSEILLLRAQIESDSGRFAEAETALREVSGLAPAAELAPAWGDLYFARGDGAAAVAAYRQGIARFPESATLERKLGEALGLQKSFAESEQAFRRSIAKSKSDRDKEAAYGDLSFLFQGERRDQEAAQILEEGTRALPESARLWGMLGAAYGRLESFPQAIAAYERSIQIQPTALACKTLAALVFEIRHDQRRAVALWRQSLALDPSQTDVQAFLRRYASR